MSKQDRQGVRDAAELERKYHFQNIGKGADKTQLSQLSQLLSQFKTSTNQKISSISKLLEELENPSAEDVGYTSSSLNAENVQSAIDELEKMVGNNLKKINVVELKISNNEKSIEQNADDIEKLENSCLKAEQWVTLFDRTLEAEERRFEVNKDLDGNTMQAKKIRISIIGTSTSAKLTLYFSNTETEEGIVFANGLKTNVAFKTIVEIGEKLSNGLSNVQCFVSSKASFGIEANNVYAAVANRNSETISQIVFAPPSNYYLQKGTRVIVEAVLK